MLEVVQAAAGTGKTTALSAARLGWEAAGYRVLGSSTATRAARELADGAGIAESKTLARLLSDLEHDVHGGFAAGTVLVVDEAGMVGSRVLQRLLEVEQRDQTKVVLVGDSAQLPEIDAGGSFRGLARRLGAHELTQNRRQSADWEREALTLLRKGHAGEAFAGPMGTRAVPSPTPGHRRRPRPTGPHRTAARAGPRRPTASAFPAGRHRRDVDRRPHR